MTTQEVILNLVSTEDRMRAINRECGLSEFAHRFMGAEEWVTAVNAVREQDRAMRMAALMLAVSSNGAQP